MNTAIIVKGPRMTRKSALNLAGDIVDQLSIRLANIEALSEAILHGSEDAMDRDKIGSLTSLAG